MTIVDMLQQSIYLTLLGMGVVFSFLIIMIVCMVLTHKVLHALKLDREEESSAPSAAAPAAGQDTAVVAAIATAIREKQTN